MHQFTSTIETELPEWMDKFQAAEYVQRKGFHSYTHNTVARAARLGMLHEGEKRGGRRDHWRKEWLDAWIDGK